jgi:hypothetical protein
MLKVGGKARVIGGYSPASWHFNESSCSTLAGPLVGHGAALSALKSQALIAQHFGLRVHYHKPGSNGSTRLATE